MTPKERLTNILLSLTLGPVTRFCGIVGGKCECGEPEGKIKVWNSKRHKFVMVPHIPGKHPPRYVRGWQEKNASTDPKTVAGWCIEYPHSNFAVVTGSASVVLDLDVRQEEPVKNGKSAKPAKNGVVELAELEQSVEQSIPPTVTVVSGGGSGAKHVYFKVPNNPAMLQKPKGTRGIEFRKNKEAIIVPGSRHKSGNYYRFAPGLSPADVEIAELPEWLLATMRKPGAISRAKSATNVTDDIGHLFHDLLNQGPPPGSLPPGRLRPDDIVTRKMKTVPMRMYPADTSHSDSHWAWTLARNCSHHWAQYLRLWKDSPIRRLDDTKCGRASYELSILTKAFLDQKQQWKNPGRRRIEETTNPALAKHMRKLLEHTETPRSPIVNAVLHLNFTKPDLDDHGIARALDATGTFEKKITREYVKRIRHRYRHLWRTG